MVIPQLATNHLFWLSRLSPDLVIFDIGTNDLDTQAPAVTKLAEQLFSFGRKLVAVRGVSHVAFLEVLPRAPGRFQSRNPAFNQLAQQFNAKLRQLIYRQHAQQTQLHCWQHRGLQLNTQQYIADGVHLTNPGKQVH
jgi:lysophospholipase L1-like esterase